ncbi:MAG: single-stranded-DNA-specific exonuclease RecJ [Solirubrobacterales bacterium]
MAASAPDPVVPGPGFTLAPFAFAEARTLVRELDVPEPVATALVRRGYRTVAQARAFLDADESHDPMLFAGMGEALERIRAAVDAGRAITVHGDYDADGVCSTAILVGALRAIGAECDWYIPDRLGDGYGLTAQGVERLRERGTGLLITTDCGITCAAEVALARGHGMDVIVTDHHQPSGELPDCTIVHPEVSGYPCPDLCATGVAYKVSAALRGADADADLDLVALATVADMVPLRGENRALVRRGLERARRGARPGLRALMAAAKVEPERLDEGDLSFRLAPRINAAGRLYRADAGVELMLTSDEARAAEIAAELDRANHERRGTEREVVAAAQAALRELPGDGAQAAGLVIAGEGWHPGVVGICASRMVEQTGRPVLLIATSEDGRARGSGRSVPGYDLLAGLTACAEHLDRFGGHRAAAGLELPAENIPALREAFAAHAAEALGDGSAPPVEEIDAVVGADELGLDVARGLARLGPFGKGNPPVRLIVPGARLRDVRPMGAGERHARFSLEGAAGRARGVAFGVNGSLAKAAEAGALDISVALEVNHWNGAVEPRVVLGELYAEEGGSPAASAGALPDEEWWRRVAAQVEGPLEGPGIPPAQDSRRAPVDRRGRSGVATVAALASSGEAVLVVCADAIRRRALVERAAVPARFGGGAVALAGASGGDGPAAANADILASGGVVLTDWQRLEREPSLPDPFEHVVLIDPPPSAELEAVADRCQSGGFLHLAWGPAEVEFAIRAWEAQWPSRPVLGGLYRRLGEPAGPSGELEAAGARAALGGDGHHARTPEVAGRCLRVLAELGLVVPGSDGGGHAGSLRVVSSKGTDLARSQAFAAYRARCEEGRRYLSRRRQPS